MIRGRPDRIINLFVDSKQHKRGIGRLLVERFEEEAGKQGSKLIRLRSSLYATGFYQRMGYKNHRHTQIPWTESQSYAENFP